METWGIYRLLVFSLAAASPAHLLDFCRNTDPQCPSHDQPGSTIPPPPGAFTSRWNASGVNLLQNMDQLRVSCQKLLEAFPLDEVHGDAVRTVKNCVFSESTPTPLRGPLRLAAVSQDVIEGILDLDVAVTQTEVFSLYVSGSRLLTGSVPLAHRYGGHQFGSWAGQLGDGRAHFLGRYTNRKGETWELQLKGSGRTPYSRSGDGRAVIRSSVREFLCSEAMYFLGVPTSRAASLIVSEEPVLRDQFYNGDVKTERGAVVLRLAPSWFRIGSLEILSRSGEIHLLRKLLNFVMEEHFPSIKWTDPDKYLVFYAAVVNQTAHLVARWTSVGFTHGVWNTDNFSLLSVTIDYGPFAFLESYHPGFVPNSSDDEGRYRFGAQADVGRFNLRKLLEALGPLLSEQQHEMAENLLRGYSGIYQMRVHQLFKAKLGLFGGEEEEEEDVRLIALLLQMMEDTQSDFTMTFRQLSEVSVQQLHNRNFTQMWALDDLSSHQRFSDWISSYLLRLSRRRNEFQVDRQEMMKRVNPRYVLRTWMAESAIKKTEMNDFSEVAMLHHTLSSPFVTQEAAEEAGFAARPPEWAKRLKVSCSS